MGKFLDKTGLATLWAKVKDHDTATLTAAKNHTNGFFTEDAAKKAIADQNGAVIHTTYIPLTQKGTANGVATLGTDGKVPTSQLPSYVDDVVEYAKMDSFPSAGEAGKIYVAQDTNKTYRWSGTTYVEISSSLALGEVTGTAYDGAKGKANADAISSLNTIVESLYPKPTIDDMVAEAESNANTYTNNQLKNYETSTVAAGKYQAKLVSGTNIKKINNVSLLGEGNVAVQPTLVSGTNIKTVNGQSILGSGNIAIEVDNLDMSGYYTKTEADGTFVKLTGDQTISGIKTFNNGIAILDSFPETTIYSTIYLCGGILNLDRDYNEFPIAFPLKSGTIALTSDIPTAMTTAEIDTICV